MRTRIAQDAVRQRAASAHTSTTATTRRARRHRRSGLLAPALSGGAALIAAALVSAACLGPATAGAAHRTASLHPERTGSTAPTRQVALEARVLMGMRWLEAWKAAHPAPAPRPAPEPTLVSAPAPVLSDATSTTTPDWACIRLHESGDRFNSPTAPGGAYGFLESTWLSLGYSGWPYEAPPWVQGQAALFLYNELGWQPWSTRFVCGL